MFTIACAVVGAFIIIMIVAVVTLGRTERIPTGLRVGMLLTGAGLLWAGPARALGRAPGPGDLLLLIGIAWSLVAAFGPAVWRQVDRLDGRLGDGFLHMGKHR